MSLPGRLLHIDGIRVFCHRANARDKASVPLVFLHGFGVSHWQFRDVLPALAKEGHEVCALDFPGFGESDRPSPRDYAYDGDAYATTVVAVLDALAIPQATLVGHSMGGAVALLVAARKPERVERVVVSDPLVYPFVMPAVGRLARLPHVGAWLFRAACSRAAIRHTLVSHIYLHPHTVTQEWVDYLWERLCRPGGMEAAHAALSYVSGPLSVVGCLHRVKAKTLIVWGENDRLFPSRWASRLSADLRGAEVRIIPECGHSPAEERSQDFVAAIVPFLSQRTEETRRRAG